LRSKKIFVELSIVSSILLLGTILFRLTDFDLSIQRIFFREDSGWFLKDYLLFKLLYKYGTIPALVVSFYSLFKLIFIKRNKMTSSRRNILIFILLTMLVGPGLIVNAIFKQHWGRPRPREIIEFGGKSTYAPVWVKVPGGRGNSFPSGHASMGFYFFIFFFILRRKNNYKAFIALIGAIIFGLTIGLSRIAQGGHFASDIFWAAGFLYLTCFSIYYSLKLDISPKQIT
jgi:membrane-associated PAP2 superfamily phosphatase